MDNKKLLIYLDCMERYAFFSRLASALAQISVECVFLTCRFSILLKGKAQNLDIRLVKKISCSEVSPDYIHGSYDVLTESITLSQASMLYAAVLQEISKIFALERFTGVLIWNGERVPDLAIRDFCRSKKIPTLFLEISNIPGKLFADPVGVNAKSSIYSDINLLSHYEVPSDDYKEWIASYISNKKKSHLVPQAQRAKPPISQFILDWIGCHLLGVAQSQKTSLLSEIGNKLKLKNKTPSIEYDNFDYKEPFVLFPLQVSDDTQLIVNSAMGNLEAIKAAAEISSELGCVLLVKLHPAERNSLKIREILELRRCSKFKLVNTNTFALIEKCERVVTINSTVGLEAKLLGKEVIVLGRAYYERIEHNVLGNLILGYFINIDYFGDKSIHPNEASALVCRLPLYTSQ